MRYSAAYLYERQNKIRYNWGCQFAVWCALLWGVCYQFLGMLFSSGSFLKELPGTRDAFAVGTVLAAVLTLMIALISVLWIGCTRGWGEIAKTVFLSKPVSFYFLITAAAGGVAAWATYITAGLLDTLFAVAGVIFYPAVGAVFARAWLKEKISTRGKAGMAAIFIGWLVLYIPLLMGRSFLKGYLLGVVTGIGWGIEGACAGRLIDITDSDTGVAVRFIYEAALWSLIFFLLLLFKPGDAVIVTLKTLLCEPFSMFVLFIIALCLAFNYMSWYRAFSLIGVFQGLVISDISGFVVVAMSMILATQMPAWPQIIASLIMMLGVLITYYNSGGAHVLREVDLKLTVKKNKYHVSSVRFPLKAKTLCFIERRGPVWDFEVAGSLSRDLKNPKLRLKCRSRVRTYMIEARAAGLIASIEDAVDESGHFQKGKLLSRYQITEFGYKRLSESGLIAYTGRKL